MITHYLWLQGEYNQCSQFSFFFIMYLVAQGAQEALRINAVFFETLDLESNMAVITLALPILQTLQYK